MAEGRSGQAEAPASDDEPEASAAEPDGGTDEIDAQDQQTGTQVFDAAPVSPTRPIEVVSSVRVPQTDRGNRSTAGEGRGGYTRAVPDPAPRHLAVDATLRSAARNGLDDNGRPIVLRSDLHRKERIGRTGTLVLFIVDASGSMAARRRMEAVKGAVLGLLRDAYERRDRVGVIAFRGPQAELLLPPTDSVELAEQAMRSLPTGGRTPLAHALVLASETIRRCLRNRKRRADPDAGALDRRQGQCRTAGSARRPVAAGARSRRRPGRGWARPHSSSTPKIATSGWAAPAKLPLRSGPSIFASTT